MFVVSHKRFVTLLTAVAAPTPWGHGPKLGSDSGERTPFLWDVIRETMPSPGTVLLSSSARSTIPCRHGFVPGSQRSRLEGLSSLLKARLSQIPNACSQCRGVQGFPLTRCFTNPFYGSASILTLKGPLFTSFLFKQNIM